MADADSAGLSARDCRVRLCWTPDTGGIDRLAVLSADETARMAGFHFERDRLLYASAHVLLRRTLSRCAPDTGPADWAFAVGPYGRPEIAEPARHRMLRFNLSHTRGLAGCVVTRGIACGIDIEARREVPTTELADRVLAPSEQAQLAAAPAEQRDAYFLRFWTLKEAYAKARGLGLSLPLRQVAFGLSPGSPALLTDPSWPGRPSAWQFAQWSPGPGHLAAVALQRGDGADVRLQFEDDSPSPCGRGAGVP